MYSTGANCQKLKFQINENSEKMPENQTIKFDR